MFQKFTNYDIVIAKHCKNYKRHYMQQNLKLHMK